MKARIYKPSKTAMQSGRAGISEWILEYESATAKTPEPLMGWSRADDTLGQVRMRFETLEAAQKFAQEQGMACSVIPTQERKIKPRNYGDNFRYIPVSEEETVKNT
ncbi:MAG: ETC complex I subunit [Alphaproteobacteria bacterium]|nr:ETC complex I subunit [Alphaproteobacteria bacterium]